MPAFTPLALPLSRQNASIGQTLNYPVTQDSYTSEFIIGVEGTLSASAATQAVEGLASIINKVSIYGTLTGYGPLTPVNNMSGPMLAELNQFIRKNYVYSFGNLAVAAPFGVYIPCCFLHEKFNGWQRYMSCLPTNLMGACTLNVTIAAQNQIDTNASPTVAFSSLSVFVQQNEYKNSTIPPLSPLVPAAQVQKGAFTFIPTSLNYLQNLSPQSGLVQQLFPNGTYMLILLRSFSATAAASRTATVRQADGSASVPGPIDTTITTLGLVLQDVNQAPRQSVDYYTIRFDNLNSIDDAIIAGNACFQFNRRLTDIFQPVIGPNQIPLNYGVNLTGTTNPRIDFCYQQLFDTMNWLGLY